jgi:hypothetical protein
MNKRALQGLIMGIAIGVVVGLGVYTFVYAKGASFLTKHRDGRIDGFDQRLEVGQGGGQE